MAHQSKLHAPVVAYVWTIAALSVVALLGAALLFEMAGGRHDVRIVGVILFGAVALGLELSKHRLPVGHVQGSVVFIVYMAAVLVFPPYWYVLINAASKLIGNLFYRARFIKVFFNTAQEILAISVGFMVYVLLGGAIPLEHFNFEHVFLPFVGLVATYFTVNSTAVSIVISLAEKRRFADVWVRNTWDLAVYDLVASMFGLAVALLYVTVVVRGDSHPIILGGVLLPILFLRHTYTVNAQLQETNRELLELMVKSVEARDPYTSGHSQRVADLARELAREMRLSFKDTESISTAALLHDVGKIYEEFAPILRKTGRLTPDERAVMQTHSSRSAELVATISNLRGSVEEIVKHHHENFNGTGYPDGLVGDEIPLGARIVMVADTADAMTTDRPYRRALSFERVVAELDKYRGVQFDPRIVDAFKRSAVIRRLVQSRMPPAARNATDDQSDMPVRLVAQ